MNLRSTRSFRLHHHHQLSIPSPCDQQVRIRDGNELALIDSCLEGELEVDGGSDVEFFGFARSRTCFEGLNEIAVLDGGEEFVEGETGNVGCVDGVGETLFPFSCEGWGTDFFVDDGGGGRRLTDGCWVREREWNS